MPYKKITGLVPATAITDDDLLVVVDSPASGAATRKITWAQILAYFASGANTLTLGNAGLHLLDTDASHDLIVSPGSNLTADRTLTLATGDADRTLTLGGDVAFADAFATSGGHAVTLTTTGATAITLPTSGTLATTSDKLSAFAATTSAELAGVISDETGSGALVFATSPTLVTPTLGVATATSINKVAITAPASGSTLTIQDGFTLLVSGDSTVNQDVSTTANVQHAMLGAGVVPSYLLHLSQSTTDASIPIYAAYIRNWTTVTADGSRGNTGLYCDCTYQSVAAGVTNSGTVVGVNSSTRINTANFAGAVSTQQAVRALAGISNATSGASITNAYGYYALVYNSVAGTTISNAYGMYIDVTQNTGTIANRWGIYVDTGVLGGNYFSTNVGIGTTAFGSSATKTLSIGSGTAPTTSPADAFQMYSADQTAGNACPHFRTENGGIVKLFQQAAIADAAGGDEVAKINAILGVLRNAGLIGT